MAEVDASAPQGQGKEVPEVIQEGLGQLAAQPESTPAPPPQPETHEPSTQVLGPEAVLPSPPAPGRASTGWTEEMEAALTGSSLKDEHRTLMGTVL